MERKEKKKKGVRVGGGGRWINLIIGDKISPVWRLHVVILTDAKKKKEKKRKNCKKINRVYPM